jgi:hypothetical protein
MGVRNPKVRMGTHYTAFTYNTYFLHQQSLTSEYQHARLDDFFILLTKVSKCEAEEGD